MNPFRYFCIHKWKISHKYHDRQKEYSLLFGTVTDTKDYEVHTLRCMKCGLFKSKNIRELKPGEFKIK